MDADIEAPPSGAEAPSCLERAERVERAVCMTSTAWGLLPSRPLAIPVAFWAVRHLVYFGLAYLLVTRLPSALPALGVFILYVHLHKAWIVLRPSSATTAEEDDDARHHRRERDHELPEKKHGASGVEYYPEKGATPTDDGAAAAAEDGAT